ncbi:MAG: hypothetical protein [Wendovervirus sonii]|uniref:Uncharacterized protein n=1 Tax=phage Lak_Megaphage_Sonny TaxID=3109229 RepID=A0ABZ0Z5E2_9CAUD|nr:MAG: hypothetical protein [phage Lak_Megaphage_Sonny]
MKDIEKNSSLNEEPMNNNDTSVKENTESVNNAESEEKINPADIIFDDDSDDMPQPDTFNYDEPNMLKMSMLFKYAVNSCMEKLPYSMDVLTNSEGKKLKVADLLKYIDDNFNNAITIDNMNLLISFIANAPKYAVSSFMDLVANNQQDLWTLLRK